MTEIINIAPTTPEMDALKARLKSTWTAGNYDYFSRYMESSAVQFLDRLDVPAGSSVLDVACGSGQLGLIAARRGLQVWGCDIAANSIAAARGRAQAEGLDAQFDEGDAEALPYPDARFDLVASIFGAMFAPRPSLVVKELLRVCRPGGRIAMANWTKEGFIGQMFRAITKFIAPQGMPSPVLWGDEATVRERFGSDVSALRLTRVNYRFDYPFPPAGVVEFFREHYGPTTRAFEVVSETDRQALRDELVSLWDANNLASEPNRTMVDSEYLEVVATRA